MSRNSVIWWEFWKKFRTHIRILTLKKRSPKKEKKVAISSLHDAVKKWPVMVKSQHPRGGLWHVQKKLSVASLG